MTVDNLQRSPVLRLLRLARPAWPRLTLAVTAGVAAAGSGIALMATSAWLISRAAQHPPVLSLMVAIVAVRAFGLSRGLLRYVERLIGHDAALRVLGDLRASSYARLTRIIPAAAADLRSGDLVTRFVADIDAALDLLVRVLLPWLVSLCVATASVALLGTLLPGSGLVLAAGLATAVVGIPALHAVVSRRGELSSAPLRGQLADQTVQLMNQLPDLIAYQATEQRVTALDATDRELRRHAGRVGIALGATAGLNSAIAGLCAVFSLSLGANAIYQHRLNPVLLAVLVLTPLAVFDALSGLPAAASGLRAGRAALGRVFAIIDREDPVPDPGTPHANPARPYHLTMRGVTARWTPGAPDALTKVDLDLPAGSRTVIVGPSGSGKSTLVALLSRLLDPVAGSITINGTDLRQLSGAQVRSIVGVVDELAYMFDASIAANLRVGSVNATDTQMHDALRRAHIETWVRQLPKGLDTPVGEHGAKLSGGQRRRLALARALLANHPILVVDEPTEHLDDVTARDLIEELFRMAPDRTVVLVTHRRTSAIAADQVVEISDGRAVAGRGARAAASASRCEV